MFDSQEEMLQQLEQSNRSPAQRTESAFAVVEGFTGMVVGISDGDTITVLHNGVGVSALDSAPITR